MKEYKVTVNGIVYQVEIEEVSSAPPSTAPKKNSIPPEKSILTPTNILSNGNTEQKNSALTSSQSESSSIQTTTPTVSTYPVKQPSSSKVTTNKEDFPLNPSSSSVSAVSLDRPPSDHVTFEAKQEVKTQTPAVNEVSLEPTTFADTKSEKEPATQPSNGTVSLEQPVLETTQDSLQESSMSPDSETKEIDTFSVEPTNLNSFPTVETGYSTEDSLCVETNSTDSTKKKAPRSRKTAKNKSDNKMSLS